ncbi:MAG: L,D-transpeptidase family protein [Chitinophagaceae bacterium]|nr:L,D-transpeptidase family protein [Chitinophagaceae bacterium]
MAKRLMIWFFIFCLVTGSYGQITPAAIEHIINSPSQFSRIPLSYPEETREFYKCQLYSPVWTDDRALITDLFQLLEQSPDLGLQEKDYQHDFIRGYRAGNFYLASLYDSVEAELKFTDAAIHFLHDILYGNRIPSIGYNGLNYSPACFDISSVLQLAIGKRQLAYLHLIIEPRTPEYAAIKEKIALYNRMLSDTSFREVKITSSKVSSANKPLLNKLYRLGFLDRADQPVPDSLLKIKVKEAQRLFNLLPDGVLRSTFLEALNEPLTARLEELCYALNTLRWLSCIKETGKIIVVNIPSATLLVYDEDKAVLESRIIVGKRSTPTPLLCSRVNEVILYPYWMVPHSIATKELLPSIKRNVGYLDANSYQVINRQGRVVDPYSIDWSTLSRSYFPYIIRQSTGCDNALGLIKLNFYNPYSVYLHDTPTKPLFAMNKRYFSHGCMRVEKAIELGRYILKDNAVAIDTLTEKGCLYNQSPVTVPAIEKLPVFVLYNTAWIDSAGRVSFSEDVYRKNRELFQRN